MSTPSPADLTKLALVLTAEERAELVGRPAEIVLTAPPLHASWEAEIARRLGEMDASVVESIPAEQVFSEMRESLGVHLPEPRI